MERTTSVSACKVGDKRVLVVVYRLKGAVRLDVAYEIEIDAACKPMVWNIARFRSGPSLNPDPQEISMCELFSIEKGPIQEAAIANTLWSAFNDFEFFAALDHLARLFLIDHVSFG